MASVVASLSSPLCFILSAIILSTKCTIICQLVSLCRQPYVTISGKRVLDLIKNALLVSFERALNTLNEVIMAFYTRFCQEHLGCKGHKPVNQT